ncbi:MAG: diaminopimelate dehydrogenase [Tissierellia bacterium]|nr:diaminopimelate dehydrogenase [Tissierellia bacterium]
MIKVGIVGYGNLGKSAEKLIKNSKDMLVYGIFTRRDPKSLDTNSNAYDFESIEDHVGKVDVMLLCGGSKSDIMKQGPLVHKYFNTVDCFDTHAKISEYLKQMDEIGNEHNTLALVSTGWDPGLFSMQRVLFESILPNSKTYTFWGKGVSQGHSDAIRRIEGVKKAIQYTIPVESTLKKVREGSNENFTDRQKHTRECFVVADCDHDRIREEIVNMKNYFSDYDTTVHFINEEEFDKNHNKLNHGGFVIRSADTGDGIQNMEFSLQLDSNPDFTAASAIAFIRAVYRLSNEGKTGAITVLDIPLSYLINKTREDLIKMI